MRLGIKQSELERETGMAFAPIRSRLYADVQRGIPTAIVREAGLEFMLFSRQADGRRNVLKVGYPFRGLYETIDIIENK